MAGNGLRRKVMSTCTLRLGGSRRAGHGGVASERRGSCGQVYLCQPLSRTKARWL